jgi:hypothetical protein
VIAGEALHRIADWASDSCHDFIQDAQTGYGAVFSRCRTWRYLLCRVTNPRAKFVGIGMLNPSQADETRDDPTIRQCRARARQAGLSGLLVWNLFAFRATRPEDLKCALDPVGPDNDAAISLALALSTRTILAWGNHGVHLGRDRAVIEQCRGADLSVLGFTGQGHPRHPLYLDRTIRLKRWHLPSER